jgi:hypothetical protein
MYHIAPQSVAILIHFFSLFNAHIVPQTPQLSTVRCLNSNIGVCNGFYSRLHSYLQEKASDGVLSISTHNRALTSPHNSCLPMPENRIWLPHRFRGATTTYLISWPTL